jgi:hypothetical protein
MDLKMKKKLFDMDAIEFISNYPTYLDEIEQIVKPELLPVVEHLRHFNPCHLVSPDVWFVSELQARGFVWTMFLKECHKRRMQ